MIIYDKTYSLVTGIEGVLLSIRGIRVEYSEYKHGNPYNTAFCVDVVSGDFKGLAYFEYNIVDFIGFIKALKDLYDFKINTVELNHDLSFGSEIKFELLRTGHVVVTGKLHGGNVGEQRLVFEFTTDQTAIKPLCYALYNDFVVNNNRMP